MTWNYRIIRHQEGHLALHEVYYDDEGKPNRVTMEPVTFVADAEEGTTDIIGSLERALNDAREKPVLEMTAFSDDSTQPG